MGELGAGSIPVAVLPSCQDMKTIALQLHKHENSWVEKTDLLQLVMYDGLVEYYGPHTASSVFLILRLDYGYLLLVHTGCVFSLISSIFIPAS